MPEVLTCSYCSRKFPHGIGMTYVKTDGTIYNFCSKKCFKSMAKRKKPKWAKKPE